MIQTMVGENSRAISILTELLQTPYWSYRYGPAAITPVLLRLDPHLGPFARRSRFPKTLRGEKQDLTTEWTLMDTNFVEKGRSHGLH